jgi:hypothetical protein
VGLVLLSPSYFFNNYASPNTDHDRNQTFASPCGPARGVCDSKHLDLLPIDLRYPSNYQKARERTNVHACIHTHLQPESHDCNHEHIHSDPVQHDYNECGNVDLFYNNYGYPGNDALSDLLFEHQLTPTKVTDIFTFTNTATISDATTTTLVSTETEFSTALTTSYATYTVPASAGFTPLASALAASGNTAAKKMRRRERLRSRVPEAEPASDVADLEKRSSSGEFCIGGPSKYPAAVTCTKLVEIVSTSTVKLTAKKTATVTAPQGTRHR